MAYVVVPCFLELRVRLACQMVVVVLTQVGLRIVSYENVLLSEIGA